MRCSYLVVAVVLSYGALGTAADAVPAARTIHSAPDRTLLTPVSWQNVCRERVFLRRDRAGRTVAVQAPVCTPVWISRRYFANGRYYADPTFTVPID